VTDPQVTLVVAVAGVFTTLLSPCIAIQVQRFIEERKEKKRRKLWIFTVLMTTRATRTAPDHVIALNSIELCFDGKSNRDTNVVDAWRIYFDHLNNVPSEEEPSEASKSMHATWMQKSNDLFVDLLKSLSDVLDFKFDKVQLRRGVYYPRAHEEVEAEQRDLRQSLLKIVSGKSSVPMEVVGFPVDKEVFEKQQKLIELLLKSLSAGALRVTVEGKHE
jgi:hypothetical protein